MSKCAQFQIRLIGNTKVTLYSANDSICCSAGNFVMYLSTKKTLMQTHAKQGLACTVHALAVQGDEKMYFSLQMTNFKKKFFGGQANTVSWGYQRSHKITEFTEGDIFPLFCSIFGLILAQMPSFIGRPYAFFPNAFATRPNAFFYRKFCFFNLVST